MADQRISLAEEFPFLRAIVNCPEDDAPRLVYADWLEERGDPRAEIVRLEVEWQRLPPTSWKRRSVVGEALQILIPKFDRRWWERLAGLRAFPPGTRQDLALVADGRGRIDVRGGADDTVLLVEGRPVALNWNDNQGSVGQYLVFTGHTCGSAHVSRLTAFVAGEVEDERPLADPLEPLLTQFPNGTYLLRYTPSSAVENVLTLECPGRAGGQPGLGGYYPFESHILIGTQPRESLSEERVAVFRDQIRAGRKPIVLTAAAEHAWCEFVIDGHHKLAAYAQERVNPTLLGIVRWEAPAISMGEGLRYLRPDHPGAAEYRRMKRGYRRGE